MKDNQEPTPEETRQSIVKKTLEYKLLQGAVGGNEVKANPYLYGQLGLQGGEETYTQTMSGEEADNERKGIYAERLEEKKQLGISEEAPYPTNYDIIAKLKKQLREVQVRAKLSELEEHAKAVGAQLDFEVPEELKGYIQSELIQKAITEDGKIDISKLDDKEKDALGMYQVVTDSYERALGLKAAQTNYFADLNKIGKQIVDKYKPRESTE